MTNCANWMHDSIFQFCDGVGKCRTGGRCVAGRLFIFQRSRLVLDGQSLDVPAGKENNHHCLGDGRYGVCSVDGLYHSGSRPGDFELVGGGWFARVAVGHLEDGTS